MLVGKRGVGTSVGLDLDLPGRYRPACRITQTGARSVSSPINKSIDVSIGEGHTTTGRH